MELGGPDYAKSGAPIADSDGYEQAQATGRGLGYRYAILLYCCVGLEVMGSMMTICISNVCVVHHIIHPGTLVLPKRCLVSRSSLRRRRLGNSASREHSFTVTLTQTTLAFETRTTGCCSRRSQ